MTDQSRAGLGPAIARCLPGALLCAGLAGLSYGVASWPAINAVAPVSPLSLGILVGVLVRLILPLPDRVAPGIAWTLHYLLRAGIILLGTRLVIQDLLSVGAGGLALVLLAVASTLVLALVVGRLLGLGDTLSLLVGCGTGICGASAVVAADGILRARQAEVTCAIAMVTVFGTLSMLVYPILGRVMSLSTPVYGAWAGTSIHEVAQAVAAGFAVSDSAGTTASLFKLSRVALLLPVCAALVLWVKRGGAAQTTNERRRTPFPLFVLAFVGVVGLNSVLALPEGVHEALVNVDGALLAAAMVAMGLTTHLGAVRRLGWRALALAGLVTLWVSALALVGSLGLAA